MGAAATLAIPSAVFAASLSASIGVLGQQRLVNSVPHRKDDLLTVLLDCHESVQLLSWPALGHEASAEDDDAKTAVR
jgi:hypothetical protein